MAQVVAFIIKISIFRFKALVIPIPIPINSRPIPIPIPINSRPIPIPIPINSRPIPIPTNAAQFQFLTWNWNWCIPTQYPLKQVRVVYDVTARIGHNFTTKDKIPTELRSGVVYEATCPVCNEKYIGETCRHLKTRINEHLSYQKRVMPPLTQPQTTTTTTTEQPQKSIINSTFHMITRSKSRMNQQLLDQRKLLPKLSTILTIEKKTANLSSHNKVQKKLVKTKSKPKNITTIHKKLTEDDIDDILKNTTTVEKKNVDIIPKSALSKHFAATGHRFNADDFDILLSDYHRYRLVIKESLLIIRRNPTLNVNERSMPLYIYPDGLSRATMTEAKQRPSTKRTTMGTYTITNYHIETFFFSLDLQQQHFVSNTTISTMIQPIQNQPTIVNPISTKQQTTTQCPNLQHHTPQKPRTQNVNTTPTENLKTPTIQHEAEDDRINDRKFQKH
ncbi:unnamed protein product [Rotaria magnacalcarata]|uniref:Uncharacterized protein n=2 Tax=Rotaria magnacalcarata TaxID=392030 RepID=A0A815Z4F3_9BILA|nr:unnamed protein product [Rotaria magnacalcarata]